MGRVAVRVASLHVFDTVEADLPRAREHHAAAVHAANVLAAVHDSPDLVPITNSDPLKWSGERIVVAAEDVCVIGHSGLLPLELRLGAYASMAVGLVGVRATGPDVLFKLIVRPELVKAEATRMLRHSCSASGATDLKLLCAAPGRGVMVRGGARRVSAGSHTLAE